jgi:hypothetical protein
VSILAQRPDRRNGRLASAARGLPQPDRRRVFLFFSNNLGCLGSIVVSLVGTLVLLLVLGVVRL